MTTDQTNVSTTTDFADSEHLRRVVATLVEEEIKRLQEEHDSTGKQSSFLNQFAGEVAVTGLSDSIKARHPCVKLLWMLIFLGGCTATGFFVYKVFEEYRNEPTATKISTLRNSTYEFPRMVICFDTWLDADKAMALGLSKEGIKFALRYLIPFEDVATQEIKKSKNVSGIREEFLRVYHENNFTSLVDFFKYIALDAVLNSEDEKQIGFSCSGCQYTERLEKVIIDKTVCYLLRLKKVDGKMRQSYGLPEFELRVPDLSRGLLDRRAYWKLYINPMKTQLMSDMPYISIYEQQAHSVRLLSEHFIAHESGQCISKNDPKHPGYSSMGCVVGCAATYYKIVHGCRVLNLDRNHSLAPTDYCNSYHWKKWPIRENVDINKTQALMFACINQCKDECETIWYHSSIDAHMSNSLVRDATAWSNRSATGVRSLMNDRWEPLFHPFWNMLIFLFGAMMTYCLLIHMRSAKVYFINLDALAGGVLTFKEVSTYSFQTLVGNIGGTCGIWIGVSVMTLIQLLMFFLERTLETGCNGNKKEKEKQKEKEKAQMIEINGKEQPEQAALV